MLYHQAADKKPEEPKKPEEKKPEEPKKEEPKKPEEKKPEEAKKPEPKKEEPKKVGLASLCPPIRCQVFDHLSAGTTEACCPSRPSCACRAKGTSSHSMRASLTMLTS